LGSDWEFLMEVRNKTDLGLNFAAEQKDQIIADVQFI
jgi:hypothetical protein